MARSRLFQLTTSRRGRLPVPLSIRQAFVISTHDLTKRSTIYTAVKDIFSETFQLTTSRRGRRGLRTSDGYDSDISTHDLTKRSTFEVPVLPENWHHFNSRPHEEVDMDGRFTGPCSIAFQLTTSRRGRPLVETSLTTMQTFQLTTSRRGRLLSYAVRHVPTQYFNSRPHEEVDVGCLSHALIASTFQLTTSRRGRQQFLRKKFSFQNHFLCSLHIIYSYYINTIFFSTLFLAKSSFFLVRIL